MAGVDGRTVVVTGAGRSLGREYALFLAREGARVVVNDLGAARDGGGIDASAADAVVSEIFEAGGQAVADHHSVADWRAAQRSCRQPLDAFGRIDGVVANAGILRDRSFLNMTLDDWTAVLNVHLFGAFHVIREAWPHMREQQFGRVVVATSTSGLYGNFGQANYGQRRTASSGSSTPSPSRARSMRSRRTPSRRSPAPG